MGLSVYNIKKWIKMFSGNSIMHVNQDMGKYFIPGEIKGYFNNLTEKVLKDKETMKKHTIPKTKDEKAGEVFFPIAIFQYGLGAYDLYLGTGNIEYFNQFMRCVNWSIENQEESGAWNNFGFIQPEAPYSSMCQGEGCSLLLRAYISTNKKEYFDKAKLAVDFMMEPIEQGGTAKFFNDGIYLYEYTNKPCVLNGWIFSLFGIYDLTLISDNPRYKEYFEVSLETLKRHIDEYDCGYWSNYDNGGLITSPFYHKLHIAQLEALILIDGDKRLVKVKDKFENYEKNFFYKKVALVKKAFQKIIEK